MPKKKLKASLVKHSKQATKKQNKTSHLIRDKIIALIFICLALFVLTFHFPSSQPSQITNEKNPIIINSKLLESKNIDNIPVRILIPKSNIDISVIPAKIVNGYWEISETTASYGLGSGTPGTKSNTVIFAHTRDGLFYNLKDTKVGDVVYVFSKNKWFRYKVNDITAVYPNQIEVIQPTKNETLTLYTCTGFNDEKRLIVTAIPLK